MMCLKRRSYGSNKCGILRFKENYDQFAVFFAFIAVIPNGIAMVESVLGGMPVTSGPSGCVPSGLHSKLIHAMLEHLHETDYTIQHEFNGLNGVFPIDSAVYYKDELLAFIEIDGETHYKANGVELRRKDLLKKYLYQYHYPSTPLFRVRSDQIHRLGYDKVGEVLAKWIESTH